MVNVGGTCRVGNGAPGAAPAITPMISHATIVSLARNYPRHVVIVHVRRQPVDTWVVVEAKRSSAVGEAEKDYILCDAAVRGLSVLIVEPIG